ncbi:proteasome stabiliser-domain-containing protein [Phlyctochytrium arcticum]|nr:proteasome stabiliser-domain-containing protein [Phlyctochytrium arcticum]
MADKELALLENVELRFAVADNDARFETTLETFLVPVINKLNSQHEVVRNKVMGICSHVSKRLKSNPNLKMPTEALVKVFAADGASQMVQSFALIYIEMAFARAEAAEKMKLCPLLTKGIAKRVPAQQVIIFQIVLPVLANYKEPNFRDPKAPAPPKDPFGWEQSPDDLKFLLDKFLDVVLYNPPPVKKKDEPEVALPLPPPGMSKNAVDFITNSGKAPWTKSPPQLRALKLGLVNLLSRSGVVPASLLVLEKFKIYLVLASGSNHEMIDAGEDGMKRHVKPDFEDEKTVRALYALYQGGGTAINSGSFRMPASPGLKIKVITFLLRSVRATNVFPNILQVGFDAIYGDNTIPKLRAIGISFVQWIARMSEPACLKPIAPVLLSGILRFISEQEPTNTQDSETSLRGFAYEAVGLLSKKAPEVFDTAILFSFFKALSVEPRNVRISVQAALSDMASTYKDIAKGPERQKFEELLLENIAKNEPQARHASLKYANTIFPSNYPLRMYLCLIGFVDEKPEVREEAKRGLSLPLPPTHGEDLVAWRQQLPPFREMAELLLKNSNVTDTVMIKPAGAAMVGSYTADMYDNSLRYLRKLLVLRADPEALPELSNVVDMGSLEAHTCEALAKHLHENLSGAEGAAAIKPYLTFIKIPLKEPDSHDSLLQSIAAGNLLELISFSPSSLAASYMPRLDWLKSFIWSSKAETRISMANILAIVATAVLERGDPEHRLEGVAKELLKPATEVNKQKQQDFRHGSVVGLGYLIGHTFLRYNTIKGYISDETLKETFTRIKAGLESDTGLELGGAAQALAEMGRYAALQTDAEFIDFMMEKLKHHIKNSKDAKLQEQLIIYLGQIAIGTQSLIQPTLDFLYSLATIFTKQVEIHFTVGEAITSVICGFEATNMRQYLDIADVKADKLPRPTNELTSASLNHILKELQPANKPIARKNAAIWLLSLIKFGKSHAIIKTNGIRIQNAFSGLLNDRDDFTQEIASKGMSLVFEIGDESGRSELVESLVSTLMEGKKIAPQSVSGETQLFHENALGAAPGGGEVGGTYQSILSLASDLNQPDLVYRFMSLASHNALWNSRRGASLGFSVIAQQASAELQPHLPKLVPKLYRFQFDPNPKVADSMQNIWKTLIKEPSKTIDEYFGLIVADTLSGLSDRQWRVREASAAALGDLVHGKDMEQIHPYIEDMWTMMFRALDDIKESVRVAAFKSCKTLTNITVRYCDPEVVSVAKGSKLISIVVPFFMTKGLGSMAEDVRNHSLKTILQICKKGGVLLRPHLTDLVATLLESLSVLEPQVLNYLTFHTDKYNISNEDLENTRLSATKSSPIMEGVLRVVEQVDQEVLAQLVPRLNTLIRKGIGLPTKAGCARFVYALVQAHPTDLKPYADSILKALTSAMNDRSIVVRKTYATAIGHISKLATEKAVTNLIQHLDKMYFEGDDEDAMAIPGITLLEIARRAPDQFKEHNKDILPLVFLGARDTREPLKKVWVETWEEATGGSSGTIRLWKDEMIVKIQYLMKTSPSWGTKRQMAIALADMAQASQFGDQTKTAIDMLLDGLTGRTWEGKEDVVNALATVTVAHKDWFLENANAKTLGSVADVLVREAKKNNKPYKRHSILALGKVFNALEIDRFAEVWEYLQPIAAGEEESDDMDVDDPREKPLTMAIKANAFKALAESFPTTTAGQATHAKDLAALFAAHLDRNVWNVRQTILEGVNLYFQKLTPESCASTLDTPTMEAVFANLFVTLSDRKYTAVREASIKALKTAFEKLQGQLSKEKCEALMKELDGAIEKEGQPMVTHRLKELKDEIKGVADNKM